MAAQPMCLRAAPKRSTKSSHPKECVHAALCKAGTSARGGAEDPALNMQGAAVAANADDECCSGDCTADQSPLQRSLQLELGSAESMGSMTFVKKRE